MNTRERIRTQAIDDAFVCERLMYARDAVANKSNTATAQLTQGMGANMLKSYQTFKATAYATSDKPKDATASIWIPELSTYYSHRVEVWTQNNKGRIKAQGVDRLPNGRVSRVWVDITAPGRTAFGKRNWIGINLYVTVEVAKKISKAEGASLAAHFDALGWISSGKPADNRMKPRRSMTRRRA